jgi:DNA-binding LytR/AlgR family response regulator
MNIKSVIIDDEPLAIQLLEEYIQKSDDIECIATFSNPIQGLQFVHEHGVDLIFLDIQMPELTGIQMMKILNKKHQIILTTAYNQYAVDGFEFDVDDYLLKPISYERFLRSIEKVQKRLNHQPPTPNITVDRSQPYIFVKSEYKVQKIDLENILYFEGLGDYVAIHTTTGKILTLEKMKQFEKSLPQHRFVRVHRSYIVHIAKIEYIERSRIVIQNNRIPISDSYKDKFWNLIGDLK